MGSVRVIVLKHQIRLLRQNAGSILVIFFIPILLAKIVQPAFRAVAEGSAKDEAHGLGKELAVAGFVVMFAYLFLTTIGSLLYKEHEWNTWDRIRTYGPTLRTVLWGKAVVSVGLLTAYLSSSLLASRVFEGVSVPASSVPKLVVAILLIAISVTLTGFVLFALCRSVQMFNAVATLIAIVFGGLAGALAPVEAQPGWLRAVADVVPAYWGRQLLVSAFSEGRVSGLGVIPSVSLLTFYCVAMFLVFRAVFHPQEPKMSWQ